DAAALWHQADAFPGDRFRRQSCDALAEQRARATTGTEESHDGRHAGSLAGAVAAEQPEQPARLQRKADAVQYMTVAVKRIHVADRQGFSRQGTPPWCAGRRRLARASLRRSPRRNATA